MEKSFFYRERTGPGAGSRRRQGLVGTLAWTAGVAGGVLALAAISTMPSLRKLGRRLTGRADSSAAGREFGDWGRRMLGRSKRQVAETLGAPPAASAGARQVAPSANYWDANTWYYPYDPGEHSAVAIEFRANRVSRVEFINSPG